MTNFIAFGLWISWKWLVAFLFCSYKSELLFFHIQELLQKAKDKDHNCGGKEKAAKYYNENEEVLKLGIETCQKKKKKQKGCAEETDTEWQRMKKQAKSINFSA